MFNRKGAEFESYSSQLQFSDSLVKSVSTFTQRYPESTLTILQLLNSFGSDPSSEAFRVLREINDLNLAKDQKEPKSEAKINIKGRTISCTAEVAELIKTAQEIAGPNNTVGTGHILIAESKRPESVILSTLITSKISPNSLKQGPAFINEMVTAARKILNRNSETGSTKSILESDDSSTEIKVLDMIQAVQSGDIKEHSSKDEWIKNVLTSLESTNVVALKSNNPEEAMSIIEGLSISLGKDKSGTFGYKSIICINPTYLEQNSDLAIKEALEMANGGILFIPDLDAYVGNTRLKSAMASGKLKIITSTPYIPESEYRKKDRVLRTCSVLNLTPMSASEAEIVLARNIKSLESSLSNGQKLSISPEAIKAATFLAYRYTAVTDLPTIQGAKLLITRAKALIKIQKSDMTSLKAKTLRPDLQIDPEDIYYSLYDLYGIDGKPEDIERYRHTAKYMGEKLVGQDQVLKDIESTLLRAKTGLGNPKRPLGSFIFLGPSGTGKTETTKVLAEFMFGSPEALTEFTMSEYSEGHTVSKLFGAPPGYAGQDAGGVLTEAIKRKPYSVVVFNEIEKAHYDVRMSLLKFLDEGFLEDRSGKIVDGRNTIIIATSNIGALESAQVSTLGEGKVYEVVHKMAIDQLRPEFINRFDKFNIFKPLSVENLEKIVDILLAPTQKILTGMGVRISLSSPARRFLAEKGFNPELGARPLKRLIETKVTDTLASMIASKELKPGMNILIDLKDNEIVLTK